MEEQIIVENQIQKPFFGMEKYHSDAKRVPMNPDEAKLFDFLHFELKQPKINAKYYCKDANDSTSFEKWRSWLGSKGSFSVNPYRNDDVSLAVNNLVDKTDWDYDSEDEDCYDHFFTKIQTEQDESDKELFYKYCPIEKKYLAIPASSC
jgi:hypothetical protein